MSYESIGYKFKNMELYKTSMTHSSYANEKRDHNMKSNERLEFLGDAILGFVTADYLYKTYKHTPEGELTKLRAAVVCEQTLYQVAMELGLDSQIYLGRGEETTGGRKRSSILSDAFEALLGAIYLDGGMDSARDFVMKFVVNRIELAEMGKAFKDYKTTLQEIVQKNRQETLSYKLLNEEGPDHNKVFTVEVLLNSNIFAKGIGKSKKEAEQMAAKNALELMGEV